MKTHVTVKRKWKVLKRIGRVYLWKYQWIILETLNMDGINSFLHDSSILVLHSILVWTALGFRFSTTAHEISSGSNCTDASLIRGRSHVHFKMRFSRNISSYLVYSTHWALGRKKAGFLDTTGAGHQQDALDGHGQVTLFPFFLKRCFECP